MWYHYLNLETINSDYINTPPLAVQLMYSATIKKYFKLYQDKTNSTVGSNKAYPCQFLLQAATQFNVLPEPLLSACQYSSTEPV